MCYHQPKSSRYWTGGRKRFIYQTQVFYAMLLTQTKEMATEHKLILGDSLDKLKELPNNSVDVIITDPPFNIGKNYGYYRDNLSHNDYIDWCKLWLKECVRILKPTGSLYLFNYPKNNAYLIPFLDEILKFRSWMTWHYPTNTGHSKKNYTRTQHSILFYTKTDNYIFNKAEVAQPYKNPTDKRIRALIKKGRNGTGPYDVFQFNIVKNVSKDKTEHPCQIPKELIKIFIKASSNPRDLVLDPFAGSFSTSVAAKELGRRSIGIEINPKFVDIGRKRLFKSISPLYSFTD